MAIGRGGDELSVLTGIVKLVLYIGVAASIVCLMSFVSLQTTIVQETEDRDLFIEGNEYTVAVPSKTLELPRLNAGLPMFMTWYLEEDDTVKRLASIFKEITADESDRDAIVAVASFAYDHTFYTDDGWADTWQRPYETLRSERGDCEDISILTGAILKAMGYDVALAHYPGHVAMGVHLENEDGMGFWHHGKYYLTLDPTCRKFAPGASYYGDPEYVINGEPGLGQALYLVFWASVMLLCTYMLKECKEESK